MDQVEHEHGRLEEMNAKGKTTFEGSRGKGEARKGLKETNLVCPLEETKQDVKGGAQSQRNDNCQGM